MQNIFWKCKPFDALSPHELYGIIRLRNEVFVVEQNCVFQDADDKDQKCFHLVGYENNKLAAYARLVPAGLSYPNYVSIGRVITSPAHRRSGMGKALMQQAINYCYNLFNTHTIKIGAQYHLKNFYEGFGFVQSSDVYNEDGIPHIEMVKE
jgi:ElaA protein